ncbi:MAG: hypothetical protein QOF69_1833 [Solirubrobacteraceae bacterium]|nr:hypothetical protein [Solirubrobacteraceae bacterium]
MAVQTRVKHTAGIPIEVRIHLDALRTQRLEAEMKALATARNASLDVVAFDPEHGLTTRLSARPLAPPDFPLCSKGRG